MCLERGFKSVSGSNAFWRLMQSVPEFRCGNSERSVSCLTARSWNYQCVAVGRTKRASRLICREKVADIERRMTTGSFESY